MKTTKIAIIGVGDISGIYLENITNMFKEIEIIGIIFVLLIEINQKIYVLNIVSEMTN